MTYPNDGLIIVFSRRFYHFRLIRGSHLFFVIVLHLQRNEVIIWLEDFSLD